MPPAFTVAHEGTDAVIIFYTDVVEVRHDDSTAWEAMSWIIRRPWADNLENRIASDTAVWLALVQSETAAEEAKEQTEALSREFNDGLLDTVLDLDFRVMMIEEFNL